MVKMIMSRRNTLSFVPFQLPQHGSQLGELIPHEFSEIFFEGFCQFVGEVAELRYISSAIPFSFYHYFLN
jgi:hypothetical protein